MALKTFVKISNISNLSDARYCAGMGVDLLGFNLSEHTGTKVQPEDFKEIAEWVAGVQFVGEFSGASIEEVQEAVKQYQIDYIEVDDLALVEPVSLLSQPLIFRLHLDTESDLETFKSRMSYLDELSKMVLIKSSNEKLHARIDEHIHHHTGNLTLLKGYGTAENESLGEFPGIELEATEEERPGFQDYGEIMDVLEALESD